MEKLQIALRLHDHTENAIGQLAHLLFERKQAQMSEVLWVGHEPRLEAFIKTQNRIELQEASG